MQPPFLPANHAVPISSSCPLTGRGALHRTQQFRVLPLVLFLRLLEELPDFPRNLVQMREILPAQTHAQLMSVIGEPERAAARILAEMQAKFGCLETLWHLVLHRNEDGQFETFFSEPTFPCLVVSLSKPPCWRPLDTGVFA